MPDRLVFETREALDQDLANATVAQLESGIETRGTATLVVSGGSTPKGLFKTLSSAPIDWAKVTVLLADERWVAEDHEDSNTNLVKSLLLRNNAQAANWIDFGAGSVDPETELARINQQLGNTGPFDVVILGMGGDSHTASLFPCSAELSEGLTTPHSALMTQPTTAPHRRLSLSKTRLLNTHMGVIHIVGDSKLDVYETATVRPDDDAHPVSHFAHASHFSLWFAP